MFIILFYEYLSFERRDENTVNASFIIVETVTSLVLVSSDVYSQLLSVKIIWFRLLFENLLKHLYLSRKIKASR